VAEIAMPRPLRLLAQNGAIGFALGVAFALMVVSTNIGSLRELLFASTDGWIGISVLMIFCGFTFASVMMGAAVMSMPGDDRDL
jgi:hypothetical protein